MNRPVTKLTSVQRTALAKRLRLYRQFDRFRNIPLVERAYKPEVGYKSYEQRFGVNFIHWVKQKVKDSKKVRVLDVGCGKGVFLSWLKKTGGERVETVGVALTRFSNPKVDQLIINHADNPKLRTRGSFDLIVSHVGGTFYAERPTEVFKRLCGILRPGGSIFVDFRLGEEVSDVLKIMKEMGIKGKVIDHQYFMVVTGQKKK